MSTRTIIVVVLALVCGLCAAVGIQGMRKTPAAVALAVAEPIVMESVVVVVAAIDKGQTLKKADVELRDIPREFAPPGALNQLAAAIDQRALIPIAKGGILINGMLGGNGAGGQRFVIQPGWRAFTIMSAGPSSSLAGALETGDRVDVLFTRANQAGPGGPMAGAADSCVRRIADLARGGLQLHAARPEQD